MTIDLGKTLRSLTIRGAVATGAGTAGLGTQLMPVFELVSPGNGELLGDALDSLLVTGGLLATVVGRLRASGPLKKEH